MSQFPSPYALLCASKPRPAPTIVTAYDLYSATQFPSPSVQSSSGSSAPLSTAPPQSVHPAARSVPMPFSAKRTHYVTDIKSRHHSAAKKVNGFNHVVAQPPQPF